MISNSSTAVSGAMATVGHPASVVHYPPRTQIERDARRLAGIVLTFARFPLLALAIALVLQGRTSALFAVVILAIVLADIFDGIAYESARTASADGIRRRHLMDAISDRIVIHSLFATAWMAGSLDLAVYLPVLFREVVMASVVSTPFITRNVVLPANLPSKIGTVLAAVTLLVGINGEGQNSALLAAFVVFSGIGIVQYARQAIR